MSGSAKRSVEEGSLEPRPESARAGRSGVDVGADALCLSAFVPLATLPHADRILGTFLAKAFPALGSAGGRSWNVVFDHERADVLSEGHAGDRTRIPVFLEASDAVVCATSKYGRQASAGFGRCRHLTSGVCDGERSSDVDAPPCPFEIADGGRPPRRYWHVAEKYFLESAVCRGSDRATCPMADRHDLARSFLFAAEYAERVKASFFGTLVVVAQRDARHVLAEVVRFRDRTLRPEWRSRVQLLFYEDYLHALKGVGEPLAEQHAVFLEPLLDT